MTHRATDVGMESDSEDVKTPPPQRGRKNSKTKVLVRSHAMCEEMSPPREPAVTPPPPHIRLILPPSEASTDDQQPSTVDVSPISAGRRTSGTLTPACGSPTATLVPSPSSRLSPSTGSPRHNGELDLPRADDEQPTESVGSEQQTSQLMSSKKFTCHCLSTSCMKCLKNQDQRGINGNNNATGNNNALLSVNRPLLRGKFRQQGSLEGSVSNSPCLSRDSSSEQYTDTTGADLDLFIPETLNRNAKDRALMLKIEQDLVNLAKDKTRTHYKFPPMSSYQRMLVHRCAAYFGMDHNVESSGKCVVVNKTKNTRIPDVGFKEHIKDDIIFSEEPRRSILKRDSNSVEEYGFKSPDRQHGFENRRSKSFEEREEEYEKVRRRIFNREHRDGSSMEEYGWSEVPWSSTDSENSSRLRPPIEHDFRYPGRLLKVQSEEVRDTLRPCVVKSYSFGGYGGVQMPNRGDSIISTQSVGPRIFTKQDSGTSSVSYRVSPSSSGYKSQSQQSESITPSPTGTPAVEAAIQQQTFARFPTEAVENPDSHLVWAVTDIQNVPKGCMIINPQTGQPFKNTDGSIYHFDPDNPLFPLALPETPKQTPPSPGRPPANHKDVPEMSPKRRQRGSPKKSVMSSATSPSLPFPQQAAQFPIYSGSYTPTPQHEVGGSGSGLPVYQPPCVMYTGYGLPPPAPSGVQPPIDQQFSTEVPPPASYYVNVPDSNLIASSAPRMSPYQPPFWNQAPMQYYQQQSQLQNQPTHRLSFTQPAYLPNSYLQTYPNQPAHSQELVPLYEQQQPIQLVYPPQAQHNQNVLYQNQLPQPQQPQAVLAYTQNPAYPPHMYPQNAHPYPPNAATPNGNAYCRQMQDVAQAMGQMSLSATTPPVTAGPTHPTAFGYPPQAKFYDMRKGNCMQKGKINGNKTFSMNSSRSSTGTSSPATTVISNYHTMYKTPPPTPPMQNPNFVYGAGYMPAVLYRQSSTSTNRSSRSPTPASDVTAFDRHRMPLPAPIYHTVPYVLPGDSRIVAGRGQPSSYRQQQPQLPQRQNKQSNDNFARSHNNKNRRSRGNKISSLPPSGKPSNM